MSRYLGNSKLFFYALICVFYYFCPLLGALLLLYFSLAKRSFVITSLIIVSFTFSLLAFCANSSGSVDTDLIRYRVQYESFSTLPYGIGFSVNILFDSINWLFAHYMLYNERSVGMIWVFVSNLFLMLSIKKLLGYFVVYNHKVYFLCYLISFFIIPLAIQNELLKQVSVFTILLYIITRKIVADRNTITFWLFVSIFFIHPSSAICLSPLYFFKNKRIQNCMPLIFMISLFLSQFDILTLVSYIPMPRLFNDLFDIEEKLSLYAQFQDWGGSKRFYMTFLFFGFMIISVLSVIRIGKYRNAIMALLMLLCILLVNMSNAHNFARLTNTLYPFFIMVFILSVSIMRFRGIVYYIFVVLVLFLSNVILYYSNMQHGYYLTYMNNDYLSLLTSNISDFLISY